MDKNHNRWQMDRYVWSIDSQETSEEHFDEEKQNKEGKKRSYADHQQGKDKGQRKKKGEGAIVLQMIATSL